MDDQCQDHKVPRFTKNCETLSRISEWKLGKYSGVDKTEK